MDYWLVRTRLGAFLVELKVLLCKEIVSLAWLGLQRA